MSCPALLTGKETRLLFLHTYSCCIGAFSIILQDTWEAEIWHFALQVAVNQNIPCCEVSVNVAHVREVFHPSSYSTQHPYQLIWRDLSITVLRENKKHSTTLLNQVCRIGGVFWEMCQLVLKISIDAMCESLNCLPLPSDMCQELHSPCILSQSWHAWLKKNQNTQLVKEKHASFWFKWFPTICWLMSVVVHSHLVTTPSRRMIFGCENWPMMLASLRKSCLCFSE